MSASWYRDRHGKVRWRFRRGEICVQLPGKPGEQIFDKALESARHGLLVQTPRRPVRGERPHPLRDRLAADFAQSVLEKARCRARGKKVPFNLKIEDIIQLMVAQDYRCALCKVPFLNVLQNEPAFRPSLDRMKPAEGYVVGNVRIVAFIANLAMNKWGEEPLWRLAELMMNNRASSPAEKEHASNNLANRSTKALIY